jgi:hypothetical protein
MRQSSNDVKANPSPRFRGDLVRRIEGFAGLLLKRISITYLHKYENTRKESKTKRRRTNQ